jgi:pimeloyl-ACP methyl ester carboxylesterase
MDVAASFQFLVDHLTQPWHVVAPDWRGFGLSEWSREGCYWLPDYLADLEGVLDHYAADAPVRLVGHSLGGNIATLYAGVRTRRIRTLVNLEGLGLAGDPVQRAPQRLAKWLDEMRTPPTLRTYPSLEAVAERLQKTNRRLAAERALYLASHWSRRRADGAYEILGDPAHKISNPYLYRAEEAVAVWSQITAPTLWVMARDSEYARKMDAVEGYGARIASIAHVRRHWLDDAGHMMHHDQPRVLADLIEAFQADPAAGGSADPRESRLGP